MADNKVTKIRMTKNRANVLALFAPDEHGHSEWVSREAILEAGLEMGKNGKGRYECFFGVYDFLWQKMSETPTNPNSLIVALRMVGFSDEKDKHKRPISKAIYAHFAGKLCVVCGSSSSLVVDHKNDLYNDPRVLNKTTQRVDDFQSLCRSCNLRKRAVAKKTRETGKRYGATNIPAWAPFGVDFIAGGEDYDPSDPDAMVGTFWHDPVAFINCLSLKRPVAPTEVEGEALVGAMAVLAL